MFPTAPLWSVLRFVLRLALRFVFGFNRHINRHANYRDAHCRVNPAPPEPLVAKMVYSGSRPFLWEISNGCHAIRGDAPLR
ncbi:hypothetical protein B0G76_6428 [Paraburkholderia sp. BL23I1N1]|nr:hypothetical protein B0G76_6428 [Paraburkholderia sp. BL23I1N1]